MIITVPMLCRVSGETFPAIAKVVANDRAAAEVIAATSAKLEGVQAVTFPQSIRDLPLGQREWFELNGIAV
jgi:hypothetical protein